MVRYMAWYIRGLISEGSNKVNRQPSNSLKFKRKPSKKVISYRQRNHAKCKLK